jgi:hypothetical protein
VAICQIARTILSFLESRDISSVILFRLRILSQEIQPVKVNSPISKFDQRLESSQSTIHHEITDFSAELQVPRSQGVIRDGIVKVRHEEEDVDEF